MSRLYTRDDWRLAAAGVLAGIATLVFVVSVWFLTRGSGGTTVTTTIATDSAATRTDMDAGPVIGRFSAGVTKRLRDTRPVTTPMRGPLQLTARDIEWLEPNGRVFARAARAVGDLVTAPMARGDVLLRNVLVSKPEVFLRETQPEVWNFVAVFEELLNAPESAEPKRRIHLDGLRIADGYVDVKRPDDAFSFRSLEADISALTLSDARLTEPLMLLATADAVFERPSTKTRLPLHASDARLTFPDGTVTFNVASVTLEKTRLADIHGVWNPAWDGYAVEAEGDAVAFEIADFRSFAPERMPEDGTATFHFRVSPLTGDGTDVALTDIAFKATGASASGDLAFQFFPTRFQLGDVDLNVEALELSLIERIMGRSLPYRGSIAGTVRGPGRDIRLDLLATLTTPAVEAPFTTRVTGSIAMLESGLDVRQLTADLRDVPLAALEAFAPGLPLAGTVTGTVSITGSPATTPMQLEMRLEVGTGLATLAGLLDLSGAVPRYDVTGRIIGVELQSIIEPGVPPVTLGGQFALAGTGFKPEEIDARLRMEGGFTGWQSNSGDTLLASIRVRNGAAEVDTFTATLATASLDAEGKWRFVEPLSGAVTYRAAIASLEPFGPYLPVVGDSAAAGAIEATGTISGALSSLRVAGRVEADEVRSGEWTASSFDATYNIALGEAVPDVQLEATGRGIGTPTAGTYAIATANVRLSPPGFQVDITAQRAQSQGEIAVSASGSVPSSGMRELYVQRAFFDLQEGRWQLARPAHVSWAGDDGVRVDSLVLRNEATAGEVVVDGRVLPLKDADFSARVAALPIGDLQQLLGRPAVVTGLVWADARIQPPGDAPHIDMTFRLQDGSVQGVPVSRLEGTLNYADSRAVARFTAALDTAGSLNVDIGIPVAIDLTDSTKARLLDDGALSGRIDAVNLSLAPVESFLATVRDVTGVLNGEITLGGTVTEPQLNGDMVLSGGHVVVPMLNQTYREIGGTLRFDGRRALLQQVSARSDGTVQVTGDITFETLDEPVFALVATMDRFRPIGVDNQADAAVDGTLNLVGRLDALVMNGAITLHDGYLLIPQFGADISSAYGDLTVASSALGDDLTPAPKAQWMQNLAVRDLTVRMGDGVWIEAQEAKLQLGGTLTVNKRQDDISILGELQGLRGTYTLSAGPIVRRFDITRAVVRFQGGTEMNPAIDVDARRIVLDPGNTGNRRINVDVHIGGTMRAPTLSLASDDAPNIPESELLSYLLFGRSTLALGASPIGQGGLLSETVGAGLVEGLSARFERALVGDLCLPLDVFQVNVGLDGASFVLGRQLADDLFVSFESYLTSINAEAGGMNDWALRFEWAFAPQASVQFGIENVKRGGRIRGLSSLLGRDSKQQGFVEFRRRWTY